MAELTIGVGGMTCGHCSAQVKKTLEALIPGLSADVSLEQGAVRLTGEVLPDDERLRAEITRIGFQYDGLQGG